MMSRLIREALRTVASIMDDTHLWRGKYVPKKKKNKIHWENLKGLQRWYIYKSIRFRFDVNTLFLISISDKAPSFYDYTIQITQ